MAPHDAIMKNQFLAAGLPVLFLSATLSAASAFEIRADHIRSDDGVSYEYRDDVEILFASDETFEISADEMTEADDASLYSGNVRIAFKSMQLQTDKASVSRDPDGNLRIRSKAADVTVGRP